MATMIPPSFHDDLRKDLGAERAVYYALKKTLDDSFTVLWSISTLDANVRQLDFVVLHPGFGVLVIEVKGGAVTLGNPMDSHRKWPATTRAGHPIQIDNPFHQAVGAGRAFMADWKANSSETRYIALTELVILPHTPQPANADAVLAPKAGQFLFQNDMAVIGPRVREAMDAAKAFGEALSEADIESIVSLYGQQHAVPEPLEEETAPPPPPPPTPSPSRPTGIRNVGLAMVASAAIIMAISLGPRIISEMTQPAPQTNAAKPAAPRPAVSQLPPGGKAPPQYTGLPEVLDTATLGLNGRRMPLAGLLPVHMPEALTSARAYLAQAGEVTCELSAAGGWRCISLVKGLDIAEVFALSGFAKANANAPESIRNAEVMARQNGKGVWGPS